MLSEPRPDSRTYIWPPCISGNCGIDGPRTRRTRRPPRRSARRLRSYVSANLSGASVAPSALTKPTLSSTRQIPLRLSLLGLKQGAHTSDLRQLPRAGELEQDGHANRDARRPDRSPMTFRPIAGLDCATRAVDRWGDAPGPERREVCSNEDWTCRALTPGSDRLQGCCSLLCGEATLAGGTLRIGALSPHKRLEVL